MVVVGYTNSTCPPLQLVYVMHVFLYTSYRIWKYEVFIHIYTVYTNDASWDSYTSSRTRRRFLRKSTKMCVFVRIIIIAVQAVTDVTVIGLSTRRTYPSSILRRRNTHTHTHTHTHKHIYEYNMYVVLLAHSAVHRS